MGVGFLIITPGFVFFGVTIDCFGAGSSGVFESNAKNSSQLSSTSVSCHLTKRVHLNFQETETDQFFLRGVYQ